MAAIELKLLLLPMMQELQLYWAKTLVVKLYVDDLTMIAIGKAHHVITSLGPRPMAWAPGRYARQERRVRR